MKRFLCFLALLCLFLGVDGFGQGLKIGDKVPDVLIRNIKGLKLNGRFVTEARMSAFSGRLLILDFWATWCAPCRAMVPVMDSLQRVFGDQLVVLPVSYESAAVVAPVLAQLQRIRPFTLPGVVGDKVLHGLFPHRSLPHYVWIDAEGIVRAITEENEVTGENISRILSGKGLVGLAEKRDPKVAYSADVPLLLNGNGGDGASLVYHSLLTGYVPGLSGGTRISRFDPVRGQLFTARNVGFPWLCRMAYNEGGRWFQDACIKVLSRDSLRMISRLSGQAYRDWLAAGNGWCYELMVPPQLATSAFGIIKEDLRRMFPQYRVTLERQRARCLALVRTSSVDKLRSTGGTRALKITPFQVTLHNAPLSELLRRLQVQYLQNSVLPVIDATGYDGAVDLELEAKLYDVSSLNKALARYDLAFVEKEAEADMLVIRDAPAPAVLQNLNPKP